MSERPEPEERGSPTWWHSRTRYAFARELAAGRRVLDIACGNGFGTMMLTERATSVVGIDQDERSVESARRLGGGKARFEVVRDGALPLEDGSVDLVVCLETLEHVPASRQVAFLAELARVSSPDGLLVVSVPDGEYERSYGLLTRAPNPWHLHTPSAAELDELLDRHAFRHRLVFEQRERIATAVLPARPEARRAALEAAVVENWDGDRPTPLSRLVVSARRAAALEPVARVALPVAFRDDPRLAEVEQILDADPTRTPRKLPLADQPAEILLATAARPRLGSAEWWSAFAAQRFCEPLASGRRVVVRGDDTGVGAMKPKAPSKPAGGGPG